MFNQDQFYKYIEDNKGKTFKYGVWDCFVFVERYYYMRTGREYFNELKNRYTSLRGYLKVLKNEGYESVTDLMDNNFCSTSLSLAKRGDVVVYNDCLGLCDGIYSIFLNQDNNFDYSFIQTNKCGSAYIVDRATNG